MRWRRAAIRTGLSLLVAVILASCGGPAASPEAPARNIVVILTDDQRYDAIGLLDPFFETPRLDEFAEGGILFENAFVTSSICSPSRASILTGQWNFRHGVLRNGTNAEPSGPTFPQLLQHAGYETAFIGKWHLGSGDEPRPGFDYWASYSGQGQYVDQLFNVDGKPVQIEGHNTDRTTDFAVEFLKRPREKPFMLFVSHKAVHAGFRPAERYLGTYNGLAYPRPATMAETEDTKRNEPRWVLAQRQSWLGVAGRYPAEGEFDEFAQRYAETVRTVDDSVGKIVDALTELGLFESTLIVFTSDNGFMMGEHGLIAKRTMYEPSIRVPMIVSCPELFAGGQRRQQMVLNTDICPTLLAAAGVAIPGEVQGRSFYPLLTGDPNEWRDAFAYTYFWEPGLPQTPTTFGLRTDRYKLVRYYGVFDRYELYDLRTDPEERHNLIAEFFMPESPMSVEANLYGPETPTDIRELYVSLSQRLDEELNRLGPMRESELTPVAGAAPMDGEDDGD
jgi:N-acetylglucosamine-6-sulfatase